ncbi:hypothetical protein [Staphylococcus simulans]|uniref:hypothetical protein n=1 Tax=Staphylococcus simulans TaxID=1286 RepID=UPI000F6B7D5F|nr:hypothetical protein [Staphylococcus simulans]VED60391.1 Uncharacterised protein [Staphylococcus simulans]
MEEIKELGILKFVFNDYTHTQYLYVDDKTGEVYFSSYDKTSENFSAVSISDITTTKRQYFEEDISPERIIKLSETNHRENYAIFSYSKELDLELKYYLMIEEEGGRKYKSLFYQNPIKLTGGTNK